MIEDIIAAGLAEMGLTDRVDPRSPALLDRYAGLLLEKNQVMNLTAITEPRDVAALHMLDSAALLGCAELEGKRLVDVGTGAGFPGMALKILVPSLEVTLLDSQAKRLEWLAEVAEELSLQGVCTVHYRAEEAGQDPEFRERFDFATARAVAELPVLCELCLPLVKVGGWFLAMKSVDCSRELESAQATVDALGGKLSSCFDYRIPGTDVTHRVVQVKKTEHTPAQFPRRWAKIAKKRL